MKLFSFFFTPSFSVFNIRGDDMNKMELLLERQRGNMDGISPSSVRCCNSIFEFKYLSWTRSGLYDPVEGVSLDIERDFSD